MKKQTTRTNDSMAEVRKNMLCCGISDIGQVRKENQDYFVSAKFSEDSILAVVCDGMGGQAGGKEASQTAGDAFLASFSEYAESIQKKSKVSGDKVQEALKKAAKVANDAILKRKLLEPELAQMGTTLVAAFTFRGIAYGINIGDSRLLMAHDGTLEQISKDHSLVQYLVDIGQMTQEEAAVSHNKNIITKAVGIGADIEPDTFMFPFDASKEQYLLLCSDGYSNVISVDSTLGFLAEAEKPMTEESLKILICSMVEEANRLGAPDNVTLAIVATAPQNGEETGGENDGI